MDTTEIMQLALSMAGMKEVPADSGIFVPGVDIRRVLLGVDIATPELLLARELKCDLVIAHHPVGQSVTSFHQVVRRHTEFMTELGVPRSVAEEATRSLVDRVEVRNHAANYMHLVSAARLISMPLMNIHQPLDEISRQTLLRALKSSSVKTVGDVVKAFERLPEFRLAATRISVRMGSEGNDAGKIALVFGAGTNGGYPVAKAYFEHGVNTVVYLHIDYDELRRLREDCHGNLIILGHMAGDSIGINAFAQGLLARGVEVVTLGVIQ